MHTTHSAPDIYQSNQLKSINNTSQKNYITESNSNQSITLTTKNYNIKSNPVQINQAHRTKTASSNEIQSKSINNISQKTTSP
jgi:hypothetical protein